MLYFLLIILNIVSFNSFAANSNTPDQIIVLKSDRVLLTVKGNKILKEYPIALGKNPIGDKIQQGDDKTPEGRYQISGKNGQSKFHLNLGISYPSALDRKQAKQLGVSPGGDIVLHGLPNRAPALLHKEIMANNWTNGCIALANKHIQELFRIVRVGTPIHILP